MSERDGWGIARRARWAEQVGERSNLGPEVAEAWSEARAEIADETASPLYGGLELEPQLGLVPIGRDPTSGLFEFAHLATGEPPVRRDDGTLRVTESTGLVFVLVPGGTFVMGAQDSDPSLASYDPAAAEDERPPREVTLFPFFLSKWEMTQGQWWRLTGEKPSHLCEGRRFRGRMDGHAADLRHPVEQVSWTSGNRWLLRMGLALPTEAQWEYAARAAGSSTPWSSGAEPSTLEGAANLADATCATSGGPEEWRYESWRDGFAGHAPVGSFSSNAFGLHDMHGNVSEWCLDVYDSGFYAERGRDDPVNSGPGRYRVRRGGAYGDSADSVRSAKRFGAHPDSCDRFSGLRPARPVVSAVGVDVSAAEASGSHR